MKRYALVLKVPGVWQTIALSWLVKLPVISIPIVLALQVSLGLGRGLGSAGLVTGAWMLGAMAGAPLLGLAMDRHGLRLVLLVGAVAQGAFWGVAAVLPYPVLVAAAFLSGLLLIPGSTVVRLVISAQVTAEHQQTGFALDSMTSQLSYLVGPGLGAVLATQLSPSLATRLLGCVLVLASVSLAIQVPSAVTGGSRQRGARADSGSGPNCGLLALLACTFAAGAVSSGFEISLLAVLRAEGDVAWVGLLIAMCGAYAVAGGFLFGMLRFPVLPWSPVLLLGLVTWPLGLVTDWRVLLIAAMPAAMLSAASFAATASALGRGRPARTRGRTMGYYGSALAGGNALGAPLAGLGIGWAGRPGTGFVIVGTFSVAVAAASRLVLLRSPAGTDPDDQLPTDPEAPSPATHIRTDLAQEG
ncbi:MFS transporter (plasmid) [Streptomyces sp. NBC_01717]|uniref:MFS transporter n=1 Tax=Streptomyces sp. NBC_01717 TaxID=2975918 RepID=UPI002E3623E6|nr:MFS transporter [Streptomyces sp. NBC_01717]